MEDTIMDKSMKLVGPILSLSNNCSAKLCFD